MFARTTCACDECVACCKRQPGPLAPGEFERIASVLGETLDEAARHFCASPGAKVMDTRTGRTFRIGTITPKMHTGRCVFLNADDRCTIHAVAPWGCSRFDTHMGLAEAQRRGTWLVQAQTDPEYQALRLTLDEATTYRPTGY